MSGSVSWLVKLGSGIQREFFSAREMISYCAGLRAGGNYDFRVVVVEHCIFDEEV